MLNVMLTMRFDERLLDPIRALSPRVRVPPERPREYLEGAPLVTLVDRVKGY